MSTHARVAEDLILKDGCKQARARGWTEWGTYAVDTDRGRQEIGGELLREFVRKRREENDPYRGFGVLEPLACFGAVLEGEEPKDPWLKLAKLMHEIVKDRKRMSKKG